MWETDNPGELEYYDLGVFPNCRLISGSLLICALIAITDKYIEGQFQTFLE